MVGHCMHASHAITCRLRGLVDINTGCRRGGIDGIGQGVGVTGLRGISNHIVGSRGIRVGGIRSTGTTLEGGGGR